MAYVRMPISTLRLVIDALIASALVNGQATAALAATLDLAPMLDSREYPRD